MNQRMKMTWRRLASAGLVTATAACGGTDGATPQVSAKGDSSSQRRPAMVRPMAAAAALFSGRCGTGASGVRECLGTVGGLAAGWSEGLTPHVLHDTIAQKIATVADTFPPGSDVAVPRKSTNGGKLWVSVESIMDANLVSPAEILSPVIMARLTKKRGDAGSVDGRYGITEGARYFLIVSPDSFDNSEDDKSRWDIVEMKTVGNRPKARLISAGTGYHPCKDNNGVNHPQKAAPFAWFVNCDLANQLDFESLMVVKSAIALDPSKRSELQAMFAPELQASFMMAVNNEDFIWITCGLGCCSTGMPGT